MTTKPQALTPLLDNIPAELREVPRWICWRHHWHRQRRRWVKMPIDPKTGQPAGTDKPETWTTFEDARTAYELLGDYDGLGFVFSADDDLLGGDLDKCIDLETGEISELAREAVDKIGGYWEISPSGTGLHFIVRGQIPKAFKDDALGVELYDRGRYFAITGRVFNDHRSVGEDWEDLEWFTRKHFPRHYEQQEKKAVAPTGKGETFFARVNDAAMQALGAWVQTLFPTARDYNGGYRVASADLGRDLEEDISIVPEGIVDWGIADMGDPREGKRTPIDLVAEWWPQQLGTEDDPFGVTPKEAALWLCEQLEIDPQDLGLGEKGRTRAERVRLRADAIDAILSCSDQHDLLDRVGQIAGQAAYGSIAVRTELMARLRERFEDLTGAKLSVADARLAMKPRDMSQKNAVRRRALTEFGNAERMLDRYGEGLMFVPELDQWYLWTGIYWRKAAGLVELEHMAKETIRALPDEVGQYNTDEERETFYKFCAASQKAAMVTNIVRLAQSDPRVMTPVDELDKHRHLLGVANGAIDLTTGKLLPPDKDHRITISTDVPYTTNAKAPRFEQTVADAFFDEADMAAFFQRIIGYAVLGDPKEDVLAIPYGSGSNGKSTILGAIRAVLGPHAKAAAAETFLSNGSNGNNSGGPREDILRLRGARMVYVSEPEEGSELREGIVKSMTGGDAMPARGVHAKATVEVVPTWTAFMPTNHKPIIKGDDHAIWRRLLPVPFTRNYDTDLVVAKDPALGDKLAAEADGILAWCVKGALAYQAEGLNAPKAVRQAREAYRNDMDLLRDWLEECCDVGPEHADTNARLWASWQVFAKERGDLSYIRTSRALGRRLSARFNAVINSHGFRGRGFAGLRVKSTSDF